MARSKGVRKIRSRRLGSEMLENRTLLAADLGLGQTILSPPSGPEPLIEPASIDGTGNNIANPELGSTAEQLIRLTSVEYADGVSEPGGVDLPSAREVSNAVVAQSESIINDRGLTNILYVWGQFIDHDIDLTLGADPAEEFPIAIPTGDPSFDPDGTGTETLPFERSNFDPLTGDSIDNPRQQVNSITAFLDGSVVYGSDQVTADSLRTFEGGQMRTSEGDLLPLDETGVFFAAGDIRANENVALISMQTLFVREHNRLAEEIADRDPTLSDEQIYQQARAMVRAELQAITYNEYLPALLGRDAIGNYEGYDSTVDPSIANIFSTAAYRYGHSTISTEIARLNSDGTVIDEGNLALRDAFFTTTPISELGIDAILKGATAVEMQEIDTQIIDDLRNFLFGAPGDGGLDLAALNIQRGRDHGLPDYNQAREDVGLPRVTSFAEITSDVDLQEDLEAIYGNVDNIDVWVGGLAEDHMRGASVGELFRTVMVDQFERIRDADRYWYENVLSGRQLERADSTTLADVIARNTGVENLQQNVFFVVDAQPGDRPREPQRDGPRNDGPRRQIDIRQDRPLTGAPQDGPRDGQVAADDGNAPLSGSDGRPGGRNVAPVVEQANTGLAGRNQGPARNDLPPGLQDDVIQTDPVRDELFAAMGRGPRR